MGTITAALAALAADLDDRFAVAFGADTTVRTALRLADLVPPGAYLRFDRIQGDRALLCGTDVAAADLFLVAPETGNDQVAALDHLEAMLSALGELSDDIARDGTDLEAVSLPLPNAGTTPLPAFRIPVDLYLSAL